MNPTTQSTTRRHHFGWWFDFVLFAYVGALFYWAFRYDVPESYWFAVFCCGPMLVLASYIWVKARRQRQMRADHTTQARVREPQDVSLLRGGLIAVILAGLAVDVIAARGSTVLAGISLTGSIFLALGVFLISLLEVVRYRRSWRVFVAMFLSLAAGAIVLYTLSWALRASSGG